MLHITAGSAECYIPELDQLSVVPKEGSMWFVVAVTPLSPPPPPRPPPPLFYEPTPLDVVIYWPGPGHGHGHTRPDHAPPVPPPRIASRSKLRPRPSPHKCVRSLSLSQCEARARARMHHSAGFSPDCQQCPLALIHGSQGAPAICSGRATTCNSHRVAAVTLQVALPL